MGDRAGGVDRRGPDIVTVAAKPAMMDPLHSEATLPARTGHARTGEAVRDIGAGPTHLPSQRGGNGGPPFA